MAGSTSFSPFGSLSPAFPILSCLILVFLWGSYALVWRQRNSVYMQKRNPTLLLLQTIAETFISINYLLDALFAVYRDNSLLFYSEMAIQYLFVPLYMLTYILRAIVMLNDYYIHHALLQQSRNMTIGRVKPNMLERTVFKLFKARKQWRRPRARLQSDHLSTPPQEAFSGVFISSQTLWQLCGAFVFFWSAVLVVDLGAWGNLTTYQQADEFNMLRWLPLYAFVAVYLFVMPWFLHATRKVQDSFHIRSEYRNSVILFYLCFVSYLMTFFYEPLDIAFVSSGLEGDLFLLILTLGGHFILLLWPAIYSFHYEKQRIKMLANLNINQFAQVLLDRAVWTEFKAFLAKDFCMENGYFVEQMLTMYQSPLYRQLRTTTITRATLTDLAPGAKLFSNTGVAEVFAESSSQMPLSQRSADALASESDVSAKIKDIFNQFVVTGSPNELNLPYSLRAKLQQEINKVDFPINILDPVLTEVINSMYMNNYPRFAKHLQSKTVS